MDFLSKLMPNAPTALIENQECIILATDLDGDRLTDLLADISDPLRAFAQKVLTHADSNININKLWDSLGYSTGNGRDMTSVMYRMDGPPIHEQTLGSADAMLLRLLDGDESMGGTKKPYDPRIHFVLIRDDLALTTDACESKTSNIVVEP